MQQNRSSGDFSKFLAGKNIWNTALYFFFTSSFPKKIERKKTGNKGAEILLPSINRSNSRSLSSFDCFNLIATRNEIVIHLISFLLQVRQSRWKKSTQAKVNSNASIKKFRLSKKLVKTRKCKLPKEKTKWVRGVYCLATLFDAGSVFKVFVAEEGYEVFLNTFLEEPSEDENFYW